MIFVYITSLASSEKFFTESKSLVLIIIPSSFILFPPLTPFWPSSELAPSSFSHQLYGSSWFSLIFLTFFLLLALLITVKLAESFKGTLIKTW